MANDKLYNYYKDLPPWAKGVVVVGGLGMVYIIGSKIYAATKPKPQDIVNVEKIIYANPYKESSSIQYARSMDVDTSVFDSEDELYKMKISIIPNFLLLTLIKKKNY